MSLSMSVVIPTYNRAHLIRRAVDSALAACRPGDEIIVVDDESTDDTLTVLAAYGDRVRVIRADRNGGPGRARNIGIQATVNPLVAFLDSDDEWVPGWTERKRLLLEARPDILFCFSDFAVRSRDANEIHNYLFQWIDDARPWDEILGAGVPLATIVPLATGQDVVRVHIGSLYLSQMRLCYVFTSSVIVRRDRAGEALRFAEDLPVYEDSVCYGRLAKAGTAAYVDAETAVQHGHTGPRASAIDGLKRDILRAAALEMVWGADPAFLQQHGAAYAHLLREVRLRVVRGWLAKGNSREARRELRRAGSGPVLYLILSWLPKAVLHLLIGVGRRLKRPES